MKKKTLIFITAMVVVLAMVTGATLAYLTTYSGTVTNSFVSGGFGTIYLQENDGGSNPTNGWLSGTGNTHTNSYTVVPGVDINKDPQFKFVFDSDTLVTSAFVYVKIEYTHSTTNGWTYSNRKLLGYVNGKQALTITLNDGWHVMNATTNEALILSIGTASNNPVSVAKGGSHAILTGASVFKNVGTADTPATIEVSDTLTESDLDVLQTNQASYNLSFSTYAIQSDGLTVANGWTQVSTMN